MSSEKNCSNYQKATLFMKKNWWIFYPGGDGQRAIAALIEQLSGDGEMTMVLTIKKYSVD
jgi:hypothetical protein